MGRPKNFTKKEKWKPVEGYGKLYSISNMGRVRRNASKRIDETGKKRRYAVTKKLVAIVSYPSRPNPKVKLRDIHGKATYYDLKNLVADHWLQPRTGSRVTWKDKKNKLDCSVYNIKEIANLDKGHKLLTAEVVAIKKELHDNWGKKGLIASLAKEYNVSPSLISRIASGKRWPEIEPILPPQKEDFLLQPEKKMEAE